MCCVIWRITYARLIYYELEKMLYLNKELIFRFANHNRTHSHARSHQNEGKINCIAK